MVNTAIPMIFAYSKTAPKVTSPDPFAKYMPTYTNRGRNIIMIVRGTTTIERRFASEKYPAIVTMAA